MFYKSIIYSVEDETKNKLFYSSDFVDLNHIYYNKTDITTLNLLFNIQITRLGFYGVQINDVINTSDNVNSSAQNIAINNVSSDDANGVVNDDVNKIFNLMRLFSKNYINDALEIFKGVTTNYDISIDFVDYTSIRQNNDFYADIANKYSRATNIKVLTDITNYSTSLITPNDYDYNTANINFKNIYGDNKFIDKNTPEINNLNNVKQINSNNSLNLYEKYYSYDYNYYNYEYNYVSIYETKYAYYKKIISNGTAINIVKNNYDYNLYTIMFIDIIYSIIANTAFTELTIKRIPEEYVSAFNEIINIYLKYNFEFEINTNLTNIENLMLQTEILAINKFLTLEQIKKYIYKLYFYELFSLNIKNVNMNSVQGDFIDFFNQLSESVNYNFKYDLNIVNIVYKFLLSLTLIITYINNNYYVNIKINKNFLMSIVNTFINEITDEHVINLFLKVNSVNYSITLYKKISNIIDIEKFIKLFSQATRELIYYNQNINSKKMIINIYEQYFKNEIFLYREYAVNDTEIKKFHITVDEFGELYFFYITWYFNNNFYKKSTTFSKIKNMIINTYIDEKLNAKIIKTFTTKIYENLYQFIGDFAIEVLLYQFWGMTYNYNAIYNKNIALAYQVLFINTYYYVLNKNTSNDSVDVIDTVIDSQINNNNINKLQILYRIYILLIVSINIVTYDDILKQILIDSHRYIVNGNYVDTINISKNTNDGLTVFSNTGYTTIYFDYLNKNIISKNLINNYYKDVQNNTIKNNVIYDIQNFKNDDIRNDFLINIYNIIYQNNKTETDIGLSYFNNTISSVFNNYKIGWEDFKSTNSVNSTNSINPVNSANSEYITSILKLINTRINEKLQTFKTVFGGTKSYIISATPEFLLYKFKDNYINNCETGDFDTIFTFIYSNYTNYLSGYNFNINVILFYYICMLVFLMMNGHKYVNMNEIINYLITLINQKIINYLNGINEDVFFDGLNKLLFVVTNNSLFVNNCIKYFETLITSYTHKYNSIQMYNTLNKNGMNNTNNTNNMNSANNTNNTNNTNNINKTIQNKYIKNNKVNIWKLFIPKIVNYNQSIVIKNWKSIDEENIIKIQNEYMLYITYINNGIVNKSGVLQLIDTIQLNIGEEIIDVINNQMFNIIHELFIDSNMLQTYNEMIGGNDDNIQNGLKPYIKQFKNKTYILPLEFYFKKIMNCIPLISCMYLDTIIRVTLKTKNIIKQQYIVNNIENMNSYQTHLNSNYMLVERDERMKISNKTIDNLIDIHNNYVLTQTVNMNDNVFIKNEIEIAKVSFEFDLNGIVKELFWTVELFINEVNINNNCVDGYDNSNNSNNSNNLQTNKLNKTNNTNNTNNANNFNSYYSSYDNYNGYNEQNNFIINTLFFVNDLLRDGINKIQNYNSITTTINKYKYNTRATNNSFINTYSFALKPEEFQPSGTFNTSAIKKFTITLFINISLIKKFVSNKNNFVVKLNLNTVGYNWIRYQAGLAGLLYIVNG